MSTQTGKDITHMKRIVCRLVDSTNEAELYSGADTKRNAIQRAAIRVLRRELGAPRHGKIPESIKTLAVYLSKEKYPASYGYYVLPADTGSRVLKIIESREFN
jgi:hypothetical protein